MNFLLASALFFTTFAVSAPAVQDCSAQIQPSLSASYNWSSPAALSLAQCLLSTQPPPSTCVFYTRGSRDNAIRYAAEYNRTTIYDVYSPQWFDTDVAPASRWKELGSLWSLFRVTSKAYAMSCSGTATLVVPEGVEPCPTSIWVTDEYDAIRTRLTKIQLPIWKASLAKDSASGIWGWVVEKMKAKVAGVLGMDVAAVDADVDAAELSKRGVWDDLQTFLRLDETEASVLRVQEKLKTAMKVVDGGDKMDWWAVMGGHKCSAKN